MMTIHSTVGLLTIDPAQTDELDDVLVILAEAAAWLAAQGIAQWASPPPPGLRARIAAEIERGEVYIARALHDGCAVGTLRFEWRDTELWQDIAGDSAGYVHTMAIRPALQGRQVGEVLIEWAKTQVRNRQRQYLRLDCVATNAALRRYYERIGFRFCGQATHGDFTGALYEFDVSESRAPGTENL